MSKNVKNRMRRKWMKKIGKSRPNHEVNAKAKANSPLGGQLTCPLAFEKKIKKIIAFRRTALKRRS
jgi:hypothetical protein